MVSAQMQRVLHKVKKRFVILLFIVALLTTYFITNTIQKTRSVDGVVSSSSVATTEHGWNLIVVNQSYMVPEDWKITLTELSSGECVDSRINKELQRMLNDAREEGVYPEVVSGYRTSKKQQELMHEKIEELMSEGYFLMDATREAVKWVSEVGHSEHQTGLAVDLNADGVNSAGYEVYEWLENNAWEYGFILRYPEDKTDITGVSYEPWHYRYVGKDASADIYKQDICLEEYIGTLK